MSENKLTQEKLEEFREIIPVNIGYLVDCDQISKENKFEVLKLAKHCTAQGLSKRRIKKYLTMFKSILSKFGWSEFSLKGASEDDLKRLVSKINQSDYSPATRKDLKISLNKYYKPKNDGRKPKKLEFMTTTQKNSTKKLPEDLLDREEIDRLVEAAKNTRNTAMISVLYESGCRIGEFKLIKIKNVQFDENGYTLRVHGKTGSRRIRLIESEKRMTVTEPSNELDLFKTTIHEHLSKLVDSGFVEKDRQEDRKWVYYEPR